jgi:regulator of sirC expression with transglutaminase-like and TPR domain
LKDLLGGLAQEYSAKTPRSDEISLARFLFKEKGFRGSESDYYNPANSNLVYVIEKKRGIPISLACVYMLVGRRLGLEIEGCGFPGHFLARIRSGGRMLLADCFNGGRLLADSDMELSSSEAVREILRTRMSPERIVARVLNNLIRAYQLAESAENGQLMADLAQRGII